MSTIGKLLISFLILAGLGIVCLHLVNPSYADRSASTPEARSAVELPQGEANFIAIISQAQRAAKETDNDMQKGGVKARRDSSICKTLESAQVANWVGTVDKIDSNNDGKGVLSIEISPDVLVKTWNNDLSDIGDDTLIEPGSPVFESASAMKPGQLVEFSGSFLPAISGDCLKEASMSLEGKLASPEWLFRFSNVAEYGSRRQATIGPQVQADRAAATDTEVVSFEPTSDVTSNSQGTDSPVLTAATPDAQPFSAVLVPTIAWKASNGNPVYREGNGVSAALLLSKVDAVYPDTAKTVGASGKCEIQFVVDPQGGVGYAKVVSPLGHGLDESAVAAVRQYRFKPATLKGEPVAVAMHTVVKFDDAAPPVSR